MKEALYYKKIGDNKVQCILCPRDCIIKEGDSGFCRARKNIEGKLYSTAYGKAANGLSIDPIEKKPLYHFLPGSTVLSFGTAGCNLRCRNCQNWSISQRAPDDPRIFNVEYSPEQIVETALSEGCESIAYTYTEPTIFFEYVLDTARLARKNGLKNVIISNGFINPEPLKELIKHIDAANIDYKGGEKFYREVSEAWLNPVQETMIALKKSKVWLEAATLIIPGENDSSKAIEGMMEWFEKNLGHEVPWHFTAFYPCYKMLDHAPTPEKTLIKIRDDALKRGFKHVYAGNMLNAEANSTYCPECKELMIKREGFSVDKNSIKEGKCSKCGAVLSGVFR